MTCTDYARHEQLIVCDHPRASVEILIRLSDGCSGRLCPDCENQIGARKWPDIAERIAGPADGLDVLEMLRALAR
jgi:hypothetical protein